MPDPVKTVLLLAANPGTAKHLRIDEEFLAIRRSHESSKLRDEFRLEIVTSARQGEIRKALLRYEPPIVHFSGHGSQASEIVIVREDGSPHLVGPEALGPFFEIFRDQVRCVVLNSCYTSLLAEKIGQHVGHVVGMNAVIEDDPAILYASAFYDAVFAGRSFATGHQLGRNAILVAGFPGHLIPELYASGAEEDADAGPADAQGSPKGAGDRAFLAELGHLYHHRRAAETLLAAIDFPRNRIPAWDVANARQFWSEVRQLLVDGVVPGVGLGDLLEEARRDYPGNPVLKQAAE